MTRALPAYMRSPWLVWPCVFLLAGCSSGSSSIAKASNEVRAHATAVRGLAEHSKAVASEILTASGPGVVADAATLIIEDQDAIIEHAVPTLQAADAITIALPTVQDREGQFAKMLRYGALIAVAAAVIAALVYFGPTIRVFLGWLNLILRPPTRQVQIGAEMAAKSLEAGEGTPIQEAGIAAQRAASPQFNKAFETAKKEIRSKKVERLAAHPKEPL